MLKSGSVDAELYDIGDTSLLINVKKGWMVAEAVKFILKQVLRMLLFVSIIVSDHSLSTTPHSQRSLR
jgi:hypothetical protein